MNKEQIQKILDEAPEGATHVDYNRPKNTTYMKGLDEHGYYYWYTMPHIVHRWVHHETIKPEVIDAFVPLSFLRAQIEESSQEWVDGLPPIGEVCEFSFHGDFDDWEPCVVFAYHEDIFACKWRKGLSEHGTYETALYKFRKPETPEQKAARQNMEWQGVFHEMSLVEVADILLANGITVDNYRKQ